MTLSLGSITLLEHLTTLRSSLLTRSPFIIKEDTSEQPDESYAQDKVWGRVQSCHAPSRRGSSASSHGKPCGPCLLGGVMEASVRWHHWSHLWPWVMDFDFQPLCPPCRSGWGLKVSAFTWWFSQVTSADPCVIKALSKITSLMEQRHFDCFPSLGDSKGFQSSVQVAELQTKCLLFRNHSTTTRTRSNA